MRPAQGCALVLALTMLAGCTSGGHGHHGGMLDTGDINPGASEALAPTSTGTFTIHCHPHPWMQQNVTVVEGGPMSFTVEIHDSLEDEGAYRFEPANITIGVGAVVTYRNMGNFTHTATQDMRDGHSMQ